MSEFDQPTIETKRIIKALVLAMSIGAAVSVIAVLPAEYGIDPTGLGKILGFSKLFQPNETGGDNMIAESPQQSIKLLKLEDAGSGPGVKKPIEASDPPPGMQYEIREDSVTITIPGGKGLEYKVLLLKHGALKYEWTIDKGIMFFDFHGEVKEQNPPEDVFYESYTVAYAHNMIGTFLSPFEGRHGWYFKNSGEADRTVSIRLKGEYRLLEK
jgi:hypothetical protein